MELQGRLSIRTIKLRGKISQGLITRLPQTSHKIKEGYDLTEIMGVEKWERVLPASLSGVARGNFPSFIPTSQERIQKYLSKNYQKKKDNLWIATEKLDGSSMTVYINNDYWCMSRNLDLVETEGNAFWRTARNQGLIESVTKAI